MKSKNSKSVKAVRPPVGSSSGPAVPSAELPAVSDSVTGAKPVSSEVVLRASRRRFTAEYKLKIVASADACVTRGDLGALLRREGLFSSTLANFRQQKALGLLDGPVAKRGKKPDAATAAELKKVSELERENRQLRRKLAQAQNVIKIQKKVAALLGETFIEVEDEIDED